MRVPVMRRGYRERARPGAPDARRPGRAPRCCDQWDPGASLSRCRASASPRSPGGPMAARARWRTSSRPSSERRSCAAARSPGGRPTRRRSRRSRCRRSSRRSRPSRGRGGRRRSTRSTSRAGTCCVAAQSSCAGPRRSRTRGPCSGSSGSTSRTTRPGSCPARARRRGPWSASSSTTRPCCGWSRGATSQGGTSRRRRAFADAEAHAMASAPVPVLEPRLPDAFDLVFADPLGMGVVARRLGEVDPRLVGRFGSLVSRVGPNHLVALPLTSPGLAYTANAPPARADRPRRPQHGHAVVALPDGELRAVEVRVDREAERLRPRSWTRGSRACSPAWTPRARRAPGWTAGPGHARRRRSLETIDPGVPVSHPSPVGIRGTDSAPDSVVAMAGGDQGDTDRTESIAGGYGAGGPGPGPGSARPRHPGTTSRPASGPAARRRGPR